MRYAFTDKEWSIKDRGLLVGMLVGQSYLRILAAIALGPAFGVIAMMRHRQTSLRKAICTT
ncbi:MAG: hypothetical protein K8F25_00815 [Fimbriimonadaceae bacterium]|nr:hypothetical protein [Alphaproteobacteria bacterium]